MHREVVATEVSKVGIAAAQHNAEANGATNVHLARLSAEEFVQVGFFCHPYGSD